MAAGRQPGFVHRALCFRLLAHVLYIAKDLRDTGNSHEAEFGAGLGAAVTATSQPCTSTRHKAAA